MYSSIKHVQYLQRPHICNQMYLNYLGGSDFEFNRIKRESTKYVYRYLEVLSQTLDLLTIACKILQEKMAL